MSKNILLAGILFSLTLSVMLTQEANALTNSPGQYRITASLGPNKVCGNHICQYGENSKWAHAVLTSQRQGPTKATGGFNGMVIMHQLVINSLAKANSVDSSITSSNEPGVIPSAQANATGSK